MSANPSPGRRVAYAVWELRRRQRDRFADYFADPVAFADDCIEWPEGMSLFGYQREMLAALPKHRRVTVRGPHGLGKTMCAALAVLWFALTRDQAGIEWKVITTASAWRQLTFYLWPEIWKWSRHIRWERVGRGSLSNRTEALSLMLRLKWGMAFPVASTDEAKIEGAHADALFYMFDEAKTIPDEIWDAAEGALTSANSMAMAISTPGPINTRFYRIHKREPGFEDWWVRHVTLEESVESGRVPADWAEQRAKQWGTNSAVYINRVLGEFASTEEDSVIPLAWVEAANERWYEWEGKEQPPLTSAGADVGYGGDRSVIAVRRGNYIEDLRSFVERDTMALTGRLAGLLHSNPRSYAVVDVIGIGAGVVDRLREMKLPVSAFNAAERTDALDSSHELGFVNKRSHAWWNMRELLDPANGSQIALPPDNLLIGDLTAPQWEVKSNGKLYVQSKDEIKAKLGRSTDAGDAVVMAFYPVRVRPTKLTLDLDGRESRWKV